MKHDQSSTSFNRKKNIAQKIYCVHNEFGEKI